MCFAGVVGGDDVGMLQPRGGFHFALKAAHGVGRFHGRRREHLDGRDALHAAVPGLEHLPHAAGADLVDDQVLAKNERLGFALQHVGRLELRDLALLHQRLSQRLRIGRQGAAQVRG